MKAMAWAWVALAMVCGGLAAGCNVGIGECHGNQGAPVVSGGGGAGGEGGFRDEAGGGGFAPFPDGGGGEGGGTGIPPWPFPGAGAIISCVVETQMTPEGEHVSLSLPNGAILVGVTAHVATIHGHLELPANMPQVQVFKSPIESPDEVSIIGAGTDDSATVIDYEKKHELSAGGNMEIIDVTSTLYTAIGITESGIGSIPGGSVTDWICRVRWGH